MITPILTLLVRAKVLRSGLHWRAGAGRARCHGEPQASRWLGVARVGVGRSSLAGGGSGGARVSRAEREPREGGLADCRSAGWHVRGETRARRARLASRRVCCHRRALVTSWKCCRGLPREPPGREGTRLRGVARTGCSISPRTSQGPGGKQPA